MVRSMLVAVLAVLVMTSQCVLVPKKSDKLADLELQQNENKKVEADTSRADTRVGHGPFFHQDNIEIQQADVQHLRHNHVHNHNDDPHMAGDGPAPASHLPAAAQLAEQYHRQMAGHQQEPQHQNDKEDNHHVEYLTYQYEGHHEHNNRHHPEPTAPAVHHPHPPHPHPHGYGGYGLPVPVPVPVAVPVGGHHHHHHHPHHEELAHHLEQEHEHHLAHQGHHHHHHGHHNSAAQLKKVLIPLAGLALLGAAAALATNPVLLQLGVVSGKRRRRSATSMEMEHRGLPSNLEDLMETTTMLPQDENEDNTFANLTRAVENDNEIGVRVREIMVLEQFLKEQSKESGRRSSSALADGALASLLTCSGLLNAQSSVCLQRMACEAHSEDTELPALEMQVVKIVLHELLSHEGIPRAVKQRVRSASSAGSKGHQCDAIYRCPPKAWQRCTNPEPQL